MQNKSGEVTPVSGTVGSTDGGNTSAIVDVQSISTPDLDLQREQPPRPMHPIAHSVNLVNQFSMLRAGRAGTVGPVLSTALGAIDLATNDFSRFRHALSDGTRSDVLWSGLNVGADLMMIGGGLCGFSSRYRVVGSLASMGGSAIKLVSDGDSYYNYFRK
jgi:hypothetical protein